MTTQEILEAARAAKSALALADGQTRTQALWGMADWLCHPDQMDAINAVYREYFTSNFPARGFAAIKAWPFPFDIEIEAIAVA